MKLVICLHSKLSAEYKWGLDLPSVKDLIKSVVIFLSSISSDHYWISDTLIWKYVAFGDCFVLTIPENRFPDGVRSRVKQHLCHKIFIVSGFLGGRDRLWNER